MRSVLRRWVACNQGSVYDGEIGYPDESVTTVVDVADVLDLRLRAIACHASQASPYDGLPVDLQDAFLCADRLVRARPPWTGGQVGTRLSLRSVPSH